MFDAPVDAWYVWVGLTVVGVTVLGVAAELPRSTQADAGAAADTIDTVAASPYPGTAEYPTRAERVRLGPYRVGLERRSGTTHATFAYGPVTPVGDDGPLRELLVGAPPEAVFDAPVELDRAAGRARNRTPTWRPANGRVIARRVVWGDVGVTLVGA
jgi:hypothetical protein